MTAADELLLDTPATRPCTHRRVHQHGTLQRYRQDRCRCLACRKANADYHRHRRREIGYGRWSAFVDAEPARAHVLDLMVAGTGWRSIAELAGLSETTVQRLLYGIPGQPPAVRILRRTADALLDLGIGRRRPTRPSLWSDP